MGDALDFYKIKVKMVFIRFLFVFFSLKFGFENIF